MLKYIGMFVIIASVCFFIILLLFTTLATTFHGGSFYGFVLYSPAFIGALNLITFGYLMSDLKPRDVSLTHYQSILWLIGVINVIGYGVLLFTVVLPLNRLQGLRLEMFFWLFGFLSISFLITSMTAYTCWKQLDNQSCVFNQ